MSIKVYDYICPECGHKHKIDGNGTMLITYAPLLKNRSIFTFKTEDGADISDNDKETFFGAFEELTESDNNLLNHLISENKILSQATTLSEDKTIQLNTCITKERIHSFCTNYVHTFYPSELSENTDRMIDIACERSGSAELVEKLLSLLEKYTIEAKIVSLIPNYVYVGISEKKGNVKKYMVDTFSYNGKAFSLKICNRCGSKLPHFLGYLPQKVISIVSGPTAGKTSMLTAIYSYLSEGRIPGLKVELDTFDPGYDEKILAIENYQKHLAPQKTTADTFPTNTVMITYENPKMPKPYFDILYKDHIKYTNDKSKEVSYAVTFVDMPGEIFQVDDIADADFSRRKICSYSDMIWNVVAAEQLAGINTAPMMSIKNKVAAAETLTTSVFNKNVNTFKAAINWQNDSKTPAACIVTKSDVYTRIFSDTAKVNSLVSEISGKKCYTDSIGTQVSFDELQKLFTTEKNKSAYPIHDDSSQNGKAEKYFVYNTCDSKIEIAYRFAYIESRTLISAIKNAWMSWSPSSEIPVFFVSPYGFYAPSKPEFEFTPMEMYELVFKPLFSSEIYSEENAYDYFFEVFSEEIRKKIYAQIAKSDNNDSISEIIKQHFEKASQNESENISDQPNTLFDFNDNMKMDLSDDNGILFGGMNFSNTDEDLDTSKFNEDFQKNLSIIYQNKHSHDFGFGITDMLAWTFAVIGIIPAVNQWFTPSEVKDIEYEYKGFFKKEIVEKDKNTNELQKVKGDEKWYINDIFTTDKNRSKVNDLISPTKNIQRPYRKFIYNKSEKDLEIFEYGPDPLHRNHRKE